MGKLTGHDIWTQDLHFLLTDGLWWTAEGAPPPMDDDIHSRVLIPELEQSPSADALPPRIVGDKDTVIQSYFGSKTWVGGVKTFKQVVVAMLVY